MTDGHFSRRAFVEEVDKLLRKHSIILLLTTSQEIEARCRILDQLSPSNKKEVENPVACQCLLRCSQQASSCFKKGVESPRRQPRSGDSRGGRQRCAEVAAEGDSRGSAAEQPGESSLEQRMKLAGIKF